MVLPELMLATSGPIPPEGDPAWALEFKWDGIRCLSATTAGTVRMLSRGRADITPSFPEIAAALAAVGERDMVLDGELVAPDPATGAPVFARIVRRMNTARPTAALRRALPVRYYVFDLLGLGGLDLRGQTYLHRREQLDALELPAGGPIVVSPHYIGGSAQQMLAVAASHHLEGLVAKRVQSTYRAGRSRAWTKIPIRQSTEVVVIGWLPSAGRSGSFASLLVAAHDRAGALRYVGMVGTGYTSRERAMLQRRLDEFATDTAPITGSVPRSVAGAARWVQPRIVGDVAYREYTASGLRHASWRGARVDRSVGEVIGPW